MVKKKLYRKAHRFFKNNPKNLPSTKLAKPKRKWRATGINPQVYKMIATQTAGGALAGSIVAGKGRRKKGALYGALGGLPLGVLGGAVAGYSARPRKRKVKTKKRRRK